MLWPRLLCFACFRGEGEGGGGSYLSYRGAKGIDGLDVEVVGRLIQEKNLWGRLRRERKEAMFGVRSGACW